MSKLKQLIQREPVRVAYIAIIVLEAIASAVFSAAEHAPAGGSVGAVVTAVLTALAGEAARGKVTPVTLTDEDSAVSNILGELDNVPAISPYVEDVEHLIPPEERKKLEGLLATSAGNELGKLGEAIGLSDADLARLVEMLQQRGLVATPAAAGVVKPGDPAEVAPEPGQGALATPPIQTDATPSQ